MPESRLKRTRTTLPSGYQFGDGRHAGRIAVSYVRAWDQPPVLEFFWRRPSDNAAELLKRRGWKFVKRNGWNTIEPD